MALSRVVVEQCRSQRRPTHWRTVSWDDIARDNMHPNHCGHKAIASNLTHLLDGAVQGPSIEAALEGELPSPLYSDRYQHTRLIKAASLWPTAAHGRWFSDADFGWIPIKVGETLRMEMSGRAFDLIFRNYPVGGWVRVLGDDHYQTLVDSKVSGQWINEEETRHVSLAEDKWRYVIVIEALDAMLDDATPPPIGSQGNRRRWNRCGARRWGTMTPVRC